MNYAKFRPILRRAPVYYLYATSISGALLCLYMSASQPIEKTPDMWGAVTRARDCVCETIMGAVVGPFVFPIYAMMRVQGLYSGQKTHLTIRITNVDE